MHAQANQKTENKAQADSRDFSEKSEQQGAALQFADNRPEITQLQKIREQGDRSSQAKQIAQLQVALNDQESKKTNNTGLPDTLKSGIENLSGYSMDHVKVHYNSNKPAQLQAHAYAQGAEIHVASGQEKHVPHEAWHVVQQMQGRVSPTMQLQGNAINDDARLEKEADVFGNKALQAGNSGNTLVQQQKSFAAIQRKGSGLIQRATIIKHESQTLDYEDASTSNDEEQEVGLEMNAVLDPLDPVQGTGTTTQKGDLYASLRTYYPGDKYVQGHLLNARLGGQAKTENLFPITEEANKSHAEFELAAKQALLGEYDKAKAGKSYYYVGYDVKMIDKSTTKNFDDSPNADIRCSFYPIDRVTKAKGNGTSTLIKSVQSAVTDKVSEKLDAAGWGYAKTKSGKNATGSGSGASQTTWMGAADIKKLPDFKVKFPTGVANLRGGRVRTSDNKVLSIELE